MTSDSLGDRMKSQYEDRTRYFLPRRTYTIVRVDGKAFHTYTRGCKKPFDEELMTSMDQATKFLCEEIQGAQYGYVQSDEISILMTDFNKITTSAWFDGNIQKITSVAASLATGKFNAWIGNRFKADGSAQFETAYFDARVFTIPDPIEVANYFIWRQKDAVRNSISMVARSFYSHKELDKKSTSDMQEMIHKKGVNWNNYPIGSKRGRMLVYRNTQWEIEEPPTFTQNKAYLESLIPVHPDFQRVPSAVD